MSSYNIAVIGISCKVDELDTPDKFSGLFRSGSCTVRDMPENRRELVNADKNDKFIKFTYLDDVDKFDNDYFGMTVAESSMTDPAQRILLEMTEQLFRNAGLSRRKMMNTNTAVVIAAADTNSRSSVSELSSSSFIGTMNAYCAGRISYFYGLNGPSFTVDSTCSSSVVAIKQICSMLKSGDAEMGVAGGINLVIDPVSEDVEDFMGITSKDGLTRSFDDGADGTGGAEAVGMILLKPLEAAERDGNKIYAVIRECELNNDGCRGANIAAPSPDGQAEIISRLIRKSGISPEQIGFIEAHGTATRIGDPIEVRSITQAFSKYTSKKQYCALTASKSNIGHAGVAAGIVGFIKAAMQLYNGEVYPICHFSKPNALIDFAESPLFPCTETIKLDAGRNFGVVDSFGFSGTNSCVLLERYDSGTKSGDDPENSKKIFSFSDKSDERLREQLSCFAEYAAECSEEDIGALSRAACSTDEHMEYRTAFTAVNKKELLEKARASAKNEYQKISESRCVFLFSGDGFTSAEEFGKCYDMAEELTKVGIEPVGIYGSAGGNFAVKALKKAISYDDALREAVSVKERRAINSEAAKRAVSKVCSDANIIFIEMGAKGILGEIAEELGNKVTAAAGQDIYELTASLYSSGAEIDTENLCVGNVLIPMFNYPFRRTSCWSGATAAIRKVNSDQTEADYDPSPENIGATVRTLWTELLDTADFGDDDDFYNVGGSSLMIMQLVQRIKMIYGIETGFEEIDDNATVNDLTALIKEKLAENKKTSISAPVHLEGMEEYPVSYEQRSMLLVSELDNNSDAYKMSAILKIDGNVDIERIAETMRNVVADYEILHTVYDRKNGGYVQKPSDSSLFEFDIFKEGFASESELLQFLKEKSKAPFQLFDKLPIRCSAALFDNRYYVLFEMHHIAGDNITVEIIISRLMDYYEQLEKNGRITERYKETITYADYSSWQNEMLVSERGRRMADFWEKYLSSPPDHAVVPYDHDKTDIRGKARSQTSTFSGETSQKVKKYISSNNSTFYIFMLTLYTQLMHRYTLKDDICVGITASNRTFDGAEETIGFFANTLVFRDRCSMDESFSAAMKRVKSNLNAILDNQEIPFEYIVDKLAPDRESNEMPFFKNMFTPAMSAYVFKNEKLSLEVIPADDGSAKFDMLIMPGENSKDELTLTVEYDTSLYNDDTIGRFLDNYGRVLEAVCGCDDVCVGKLEFDDEEYGTEEVDYDF